MTGFMLPPVADEQPPRSWRATIFTCIGLVLIIMVMFRLGRPEPFDETKVQPILPATEETLAQGIAAFRSKDGIKAYSLLLPHAKEGNAEAQSILAAIYASGFFGDYLRDNCIGVTWLDKSARGGFAYSMALLSTHYKEGAGVKRNPEKAYLWLRQAETNIEPRLDPRYQDRIRTLAEWRFDRKRRLALGLPPVSDFESSFQAWNYRDERAVSTAPLPDIPVIDFFAEVFRVDGQGCHSDVTAYPLDFVP